MTRNACEWAVLSVGALLWTVVAGADGAHAAGIEWETHGAFQTCLDEKVKAWLDARVELVVNDDPSVGNIDDPAVAAWAADALRGCAAKGASDPGSEQRFMKYMAHWREHIYRAADEIKRKARPD
jgi:hypothetical protein